MAETQVVYDSRKHGELPARFIAACKGNVEDAKKRWAATAEWRIHENIDALLDQPQHKFNEIKNNYPQYVHGRAKNGHFVYYERPGLADFNILTQIADFDELLMYYVYTTEWIWRVLDQREEGRLVSVWDMTGASASSLVGDRLKMLKRTMSVISEHYPERSDKLFIINAPFWFSATWRIVSPWIDPTTRNKISILGSSYSSALNEYIGAENIPVDFGGTDNRKLGDSDEESQLKQFVMDKIAQHMKKQHKIIQSKGAEEVRERSSTTTSRSSEHSAGDTDYETVSDGEGGTDTEDEEYESFKSTQVGSPVQDRSVVLTAAAATQEDHSGVNGSLHNNTHLSREQVNAIESLDELMRTVEEISRCLDEQKKQIQDYLTIRDRHKRDMDEVVGRKSGLQNQMLSLLWSDEHLSHSSPLNGAAAASSSSLSASSSSYGAISLTLTMQLKRIMTEAERLCVRGNEIQVLLDAAEAVVEGAETVADTLVAQKMEASRRLSELLALAVEM